MSLFIIVSTICLLPLCLLREGYHPCCWLFKYTTGGSSGCTESFYVDRRVIRGHTIGCILLWTDWFFLNYFHFDLIQTTFFDFLSKSFDKTQVNILIPSRFKINNLLSLQINIWPLVASFKSINFILSEFIIKWLVLFHNGFVAGKVIFFEGQDIGYDFRAHYYRVVLEDFIPI